jgi:hypothetical protein
LISSFFSFLSKFFFFFRKFNKKEFFKKILIKSSAKIVIVIGIDGDLCFAARKEKILIIELFHFIGLTTVPKAYYWMKTSENFLPNVVLSLDQITSKTFAFLKKKKIVIKNIPHPFLYNFSKKKYFQKDNQYLKKIGFYKYKHKVIISLSWIYASDCMEYPGLNKILKNELFYDGLKELVKSEKDIFWSFRLHPVQLKLTKYKRMINYMDNFTKKNENTDYKEISKLPLLEALNLHDCHLQMSSSVCYEAAALGLKSLVLCPSVMKGGLDEHRFVDLIKEGYVRKEFFKKELVKNWILSTYKKKPRELNKEDKIKYNQILDWILLSGKLI